MKNNKDRENSLKSGNQNKGVRTGNARKKRWWVVLLLIVAALAVSGLVAATRKAAPVTFDGGTFTVRRDNLIVTVTEGGSIRPRRSVEYKCQVQRRGMGSDVTILSIVPAGTYVTQEDVNNGMVLVQLDSSSLEDRLVQEEMSLASDRESATSAKEAYEIQLLQNESDIADGELRVRFALMDLQKYLGAKLAAKLTEDVNAITSLTEHIAPLIKEVEKDPNILDGSAAGEDLKRLRDNITLANGNLTTAEITLEGTKKLFDANYVSKLDLQRDTLSRESRRFSAESADVALKLFMNYDFPKTAEQQMSNYIEARRQLQRIYAQCRSKQAQAQIRLSMAESRYKSQDEQFKQLVQQIDNCTIRAKAPGLVIFGTGGSGDIFRAMRGRSGGGGGGGGGIIAEGEAVYEGQIIISMPDTADMIAEVSVHETEVDKVRPGQAATIVMDAFPDRMLQGKVLEVAPLPDEQRSYLNPDLKVYPTKVSIDGAHDFLRTRMSCKVRILVEQLEDVIIVPIQVVSNRGGRKVCYVKTAQGAQERQVQTGAFNDMFVQILEGLEVGEEVLLNPPSFSESAGSNVFQQQVQQPKEAAAEPAKTEVGSGPVQMPPQTQSADGGQRSGRRGRGMQGGAEISGGRGQATGQNSSQLDPAEGVRQGGRNRAEMTDEELKLRMEQINSRRDARNGTGQSNDQAGQDFQQRSRAGQGGRGNDTTTP